LTGHQKFNLGKENDMTKNQINPKRFVLRLEEPPVSQALFGEVRWAWIWLIVRLYVGWQWLQAGLGKLGNPAWTGDQAGAALSGFVNGALEKTSGAHPDVQAWYAWFLETAVLPNARYWGYLVTFGELVVGVALILGIFTGIAAFFGSFMNMSYLLAGAVSSNPILLLLGGFLVLAWRTAGWWGLDRWVLPTLGTPWSPGLVFEEDGKSPEEQSAAATS
jgi:thiosulfate dehydrogenase [quinone] large subunit